MSNFDSTKTEHIDQQQSGCPHLSNRKKENELPDICRSRAYDTRGSIPLSSIMDESSKDAPVGVNQANNQYTNDNKSTVDSSLPIKRLVSSIPRTKENDGDEQEYWVYPSQQQFYNAMKRKNFEPSEDDMAVVVSMHNAVNEKTWRRVLMWEAKYRESCGNITLKKFEGKSEEYSPKARILSWFGYSLPFDRHDWIVDRCGKEVRYIIDFYDGKHVPNALTSVHMDVRPALDSAENIKDRVTRFCKEMLFYAGLFNGK